MKSILMLHVFVLFLVGNAFASSILPPLNPHQQYELKDKINYCTWCHGGQNNGIAPSINGQTPEYLNLQIQNFVSEKRDNPNARDIMWNAVNNMDPVLTPYLLEYFSQLKLEGRNHVNKNLAAQGQLIYQNGIASKNVVACRFCHGDNALGNGLFPRLAGQDKYYIINQFEDWRHGYRAYAVPMPDYAKSLTSDEVKALAEFLTSI